MEESELFKTEGRREMLSESLAVLLTRSTWSSWHGGWMKYRHTTNL